jgi:hypothetical protein
MGQEQLTCSSTPSTRTSRFPPRQCQRKGCHCVFVPGRWNQRSCRQRACLLELHRWQAAKRQQRRRSQAEVRRQHAEAEHLRRGRQREEARVRQAEQSSLVSSSSASIDAPKRRAWSRSKKRILVIFATDRAVSSRCVLPVVLQLITAATSAAKPCTVCGTGNASTSGARTRRLIDGYATKMAPQDETEGQGPATRRRIEGRGRCLPVG